MQGNINKRVKVFFYDSPNHVTCKSGILSDRDNSFVSVDTGLSRELIAIDKIVRIEVIG